MLEKYKNLVEIVVIGGWKSIREGISIGLKEKLKGKCVIVCNYAYKHFVHNILVCVDANFYVPDYAKYYTHKDIIRHQDIYEELKNESFIITPKNIPENLLLPNTLMVNATGKYNNDPMKKGFFNPMLCGIFALHIAEYLNPKRIFILGYDWNRRTNLPERDPNYSGKTNLDIHYYKKEIPHRGIGYVGFYENHNPNQYFKNFNNSKCKIYNVSLNSNIQNFSKISYQKMFTFLTQSE